MIPKKAIKKIKNEAHVEIAVGTLIAYGVFPQTNEGIQKAKNTLAGKEEWLAPSNLPEYYDGIDSDLITGKETPGIIAIRKHLKEFYKLSAGTQEFVDTSLTEEETIASPKLPPAHYIQGQKARWQPEFENEIDHAIYFAGKSPLPKGAKQREVLQWLKSLGLTYEQIHDHREKVLEQMRETISLPGVEEEYPYVYIDAVDQDFVLDTEDDEEFDETEDDIEDLDDLLNLVRSEEDIPEKEIAENIEEEIVDVVGEDEEDEEEEEDEEGDIGSEDDIPDELLQDDVDPELLDKLLITINKPKKESSYTSNKKIFDSIIVNFGRVQSTLDTINNNLEKQNTLIKANIDTQLAIGELISNQTDLLGEKFDAILNEFQKKAQQAKDFADDEKKRLDERALEGQQDVAGVTDYQDLTKGPQNKKRGNRIEQYFRAKLARKLYRKLPKSVRNARQKVRRLQRLPGRAQAKVVNRITSMLPTRGQQAVGALSKIRGAGNIGRIAGPARYAFAGLEYAERKESGQSEVQALSGVGGGLAGAAAGGAAGAKAGAAIGAAIGVWFGGVGAAPGAGIGAILGGLIGGIGGGMLGSNVADTITGAHETGTGLTKPGTALLHGREAVINRDAVDMSPLNTLGGIMIASTTEYINSAGAVAAPIAPSLRGVSVQMARQYDVPATLAQTNVGGSLPNLSRELKKVREKRKKTSQEELSGMEKDLLETQDPQSFADKLLKMLDPEGKFQELLKQINQRRTTDDDPMDLELIGDGAFDTGLRTGPSAVIGGSTDYHQDLSFAPGVGIEEQRKLILQLAVAYDKVGRKMELSNEGVAGKIFPINGTNAEQIKWIEDARAAHRARNGGTGRDAIDFYAPSKNENRSGKSVENAPILAPVIEGGGARYFSGGASGAGIALSDKEGKEILKIIHGRTDIPLPKGGAIPSASSRQLPTAQGLGRQGAAGNKNFGAASGVGSKGYLIVPGHGAGGGAPEEKKLVKQLAKNAYDNIRRKYPDVKVEYQDTDGMFEDTDLGPSFPPDKRYPGFNKQLEWFKQKEKEGWEILEIHMDASMESGEGTGRGVIAPTNELNPVEAYFAQNYGAFARGHRGLGASKRGVGILELGNMSPELQEATKQNRVTKEQKDALTAPAERAFGVISNNITPPSSSNRLDRFQSMNQAGTSEDKKYLIVNQQEKPRITGQGSQTAAQFVPMSPGRWRSEVELIEQIRSLYIQRLGQ